MTGCKTAGAGSGHGSSRPCFECLIQGAVLHRPNRIRPLPCRATFTMCGRGTITGWGCAGDDVVFRFVDIRKRGTQGRLETERKGSGGFQKENLHAADKALRIGGAFHCGTIDADSTRRTQCHSLFTSDSSSPIYKYIHVVSSHHHLYEAVQGSMMGKTPDNRRDRHIPTCPGASSVNERGITITTIRTRASPLPLTCTCLRGVSCQPHLRSTMGFSPESRLILYLLGPLV